MTKIELIQRNDDGSLLRVWGRLLDRPFTVTHVGAEWRASLEVNPRLACLGVGGTPTAAITAAVHRLRAFEEKFPNASTHQRRRKV